MTIAKHLLGTWKLISFVVEDVNKAKRKWRENPHGLLIYTADGYMSVSINSEVSVTSTLEEKYKNILFYAGTYKTDDNKVIHHVMNASDINRINSDMIRNVNLENNKLTLSSDGEYGTATLTWEKIN